MEKRVPEDPSRDDLQCPGEVSWCQRYAKNCLGSYRRGQTVPKRRVPSTVDTLRDTLETQIRFINLEIPRCLMAWSTAGLRARAAMEMTSGPLDKVIPDNEYRNSPLTQLKSN